MENRTSVSEVGVRRSRRKNFGVAPERYPEPILPGGMSKTSVRAAMSQNSPGQNKYHSEDNLAANFSSRLEVQNKTDNCSVGNVTLKSKSRSYRSNHSELATLRLDLELIQQRERLEEEEAQERIKAIEAQEKLNSISRKNEILKQKIDAQKKILELEHCDSVSSSSRSSRNTSCPNSLYGGEEIKKWVEDGKKYSEFINIDQPLNLSQEVPHADNLFNYHLDNDDLKNSPSVQFNNENTDHNLLLKIAKQCVENTSNTNKFLFGQKLRDLVHFSGELSEWPIFISEFRRTTDAYGISDAENLIRLDRALRGKARETVRALLTSPNNVPKIIRMLEMNFGRTEWIIMSLIDKVRKFAPVKEDRLETFISLSNTVNNMVITMENINGSSYLNNPELISTLLEKFPVAQKYNWAKYRRQLELQKLQITLKEFAFWLEEEADLMACIKNPFDKNKSSCKKENVLVSEKRHARSVRTSSVVTGCTFCKDDKHNIQECGIFLEKPIEQRRDAVLTLKLCFLCLKAGHVAQKCFWKKRCGENGCKGKHNKLLHLEKKGEQKPEEQPSPDSNFCGNLIKEDNKTALLRIAPVKICGPTAEIETFALFDEGSTCSMIDEHVAESLGLTGPTLPLCFQWTNGIVHFEDNSKLVTLDISSASLHPNYYKMNGVRTVETLKLPKQNINVEEICQEFPYLDSTILMSIRSAIPQLLIGQDNYGLIVPRQIIQPDLQAPVMSKSRLGWTISGAVNFNKEGPRHINLCCQHLQDLHILVKDSFKLESFGLKPESIVKSVEDRKAVDIMEKTLTRFGDRFEIGHLWKDESTTLPDSYPNAYNRLICMERKMSKDPDFAVQYCQKIEDYKSKKYARKLSPLEAAVTPKKTWYLPHFAVWHAKKKDTIRLVFDAACRSEGKSLNDFLLPGPDYVPSLVTILWRFRQGRIAFSGDVKEMFHQVVIRQEDRCAQRFLWRGMERDHDPDVYQMDVLIFGAVSSPSVAQFVKNKNASEFETDFPGITRCMERQHYVDDYLDSCFDEDAAIKRVADVIFVHNKAGFQMVKWITNSEVVLRSIPKELRSPSQSQMIIDSEKIERVLGLCWFPKYDEFIFSLNCEKIPSKTKIPTKREILRFVMSIFDPLGFLAPIIIQARILMQEIWKVSIDWDTSIPDDIFVKWQKWLLDLKKIMPVKIPRYYFPSLSSVSEVTLHVFSDASEKAYSSVGYIVCGSPENRYVSFVSSKFKVAPLKQQTIPKLELQGAVLSCRLGKAICNEIEYIIKQVFYWTDSMIVLKQIRSQSRRFPSFVACRIGEIQEETDISQWRWVPSELNVADKATKEGKNSDLDIWLQGPQFLRLSDDLWPKEPELKCEDVCVTTKYPDQIFVLPDVNRFSNWFRLVRSTGWILKFKDAILSQVSIKSKKTVKHQVSKQNSLILDIKFINEASVLWIKWSQYNSFEEVSVLSKNKYISKSSRLFKLSPFIDQDGILRLTGRFPDANLNLSNDSRFPIILDPKNKYTELLIDYHHKQAGHVGVETVINNLRTKFWILHIRSAVKKVFAKCQFCKVRNCKPVIPEMGLLPSARLEENVFPFTYVGIDLFGSMNVSIGRRTEKRYGVLFTCLTIRAIHIELVASLETSSTIMAIRRFCCRRGQPKEIWTDNGTNFVGSERELKGWFDSLDHQRISDNLSVQGTRWKFNCPLAPNMAGVWERMIKSVKRSLKVTLNTVKPKEEVLLTLLLEAEYIINSRPLTHISVDPIDPEAITPNHFLLLRPGGVRSSGPNSLVTKKQWIFAQALADLYWKRWVQEYRPSLINRQKWHQKGTPIKTEDIVVIVDEKSPRNEWLLGKIQEVYPGKDGIIRVAKVVTTKGTYTRPVSKLCVLPVS